MRLFTRIAIAIFISTTVPILLLYLTVSGRITFQMDTMIILITGLVMLTWIYNSIVRPLEALRKATNDIKDYKRLKQKLMNEIVSLMGENNEPLSGEAAKKQEENKRLIEDCNDKIDEAQDLLMDLDSEIYRENRTLMLMSMEVCYDAIRENTEQIREIEKWINEIRIELKKNVVRKQEKEMYNEELYAYMHDIFGPDVIEIFDMQYNPDDNPMKRNGRMVISHDSKEVRGADRES